MKVLIRDILGRETVSFLSKLAKKYFPTDQITEEKRELEKRIKFYSSFISKNELCFDVGANIGNRIEPLLLLGANIVAIEPQEQCHEILQNRFGDKIVIVTKGLSDIEETKDFYISNASTISSFSKEWINSVKDGRFKAYQWRETIKVEMTTLDALINIYGIPSFIKIDVEGYELEVLKGLSQPIKTISFEYTVPEQVERAIDCIKQIEKFAPNLECNYSVGETMQFTYDKWIKPAEMKLHIRSSGFIDSHFGDIYCRLRE
ncbi:hypothetical protein DYBT9275_04165 [Dyadobacter sp. CECT 9275]|uniref:Methyltransferase FkbM domain-containing protein n=1 Tax=Dyadobacter helix TaxID=2822344 RepID=A0A916JFZ8_9BACT|nr:FkbM family methyltransferase [Dyadobacter sp. CECT 9275]CAG5007963.1 hypothetical protein DYBT9275_04165 [Dyadobacter sp. CECT 9275]